MSLDANFSCTTLPDDFIALHVGDKLTITIECEVSHKHEGEEASSLSVNVINHETSNVEHDGTNQAFGEAAGRAKNGFRTMGTGG